MQLTRKLKAGVDHQDYNGDGALHDAARFGHIGVVSALLAHGADITAKNKAGQTPAMVAEAYGKASVAAMLI